MAAVSDVLGGRYRLVASLGRGPHGEVFVAVQIGLDKRVAVKVPEDVDRSRVEREARATARIEGDGILRVLECRMDLEPAFVVSELATGRSLASLVGTPIGVDRATAIARAFLTAVGAAHRARVVHGDLRPSNIFVDGDAVQLGDFGFAEDEVDHTRTSTLALRATAGYRSPERLRGHVADVSSDIFAAGACLYELVSGRRPFSADTGLDEMTRVLTDEPVPLAGPLGDAIMRALAKRPEARFASAKEMREALEGRSRSPLWMGAAVLFLSLVGFLVVQSRSTARARPPSPIASLPVVPSSAPSTSTAPGVEVEPLPPPPTSSARSSPRPFTIHWNRGRFLDSEQIGMRAKVDAATGCRSEDATARGELLVIVPARSNVGRIVEDGRSVYTKRFFYCVQGWTSEIHFTTAFEDRSFGIVFR